MCCTVLLLTECFFSLQVMAHSTPQGILDDVAMVSSLSLNHKVTLFKLTFWWGNWLFEPDIVVDLNFNSFVLFGVYGSFILKSHWQHIKTQKTYLKMAKYVLINKFLFLYRDYVYCDHAIIFS